eukprot:GCRY01000825.1.p1 GENE.GCRY01000825.1~~GCRY01000825.1.p1  ORF type:complete len:519 (-),score=194.63 GCRY01000825.1:4-1560(-)
MFAQLEKNKKLLELLPGNKALWDFFLFCTEVPRPSGCLDTIREKLVEVGKAIGCSAEVDKIGNVLLRKEATKGYENATCVCLQGHMDIVAVKDEGVTIDFEKDPLSVTFFEGDKNWLTAEGTTLGGDNGIGVAAALAILADEKLVHPPIEALFTVDEETEMTGAENLGPAPFLKSKILINCDSEEEGKICLGCAGGFETHFKIPVTPVALKNEEYTEMALEVKGLRGGHTGCEIQEGRLNALKAVARIVAAVDVEKVNAHLISLNSGTACNAVPVQCLARFAIPVAHMSAFVEACEKEWVTIKKEFIPIEGKYNAEKEQFETEMTHSVLPKTLSAETPAVSPSNTRKIFDFIRLVPHGVQRMSPDVEGLVETSIALVIARFTPEMDHVFLHTHARSSSATQLTDFDRQLHSLGRLAGVDVSEQKVPYPGWQPNPHSKALQFMQGAFEKVTGKRAEEYAIHAGLECGLVLQNYPEMECISVGPTILDPHSIKERLHIPSSNEFYEITKECLTIIAEATK